MAPHLMRSRMHKLGHADAQVALLEGDHFFQTSEAWATPALDRTPAQEHPTPSPRVPPCSPAADARHMRWPAARPSHPTAVGDEAGPCRCAGGAIARL